MLRPAIAVGLLLGFVVSPLAAESFRNPPSRPLLVMTTYSTTVGGPLAGPSIDPRVFVNSLFVFADRTLIQSFNQSPEPFGVRPQVSSHVRGRVPNAEWSALLSQMAAAHIDTHLDCERVPVGLPPPGSSPTSEVTIRWYGRQGRRNTFSIFDGSDSASICDNQLLLLLNFIGNATAKVIAAPTSEYFAVP